MGLPSPWEQLGVINLLLLHCSVIAAVNTALWVYPGASLAHAISAIVRKKEKKNCCCKCWALCSSIKHLSGMWGMREWERKPEREGWLSLSLQSPTWQVFTVKVKPFNISFHLFLTLLNSSLKRFYSRGSVCVLWDMISCTLQLWDHMEHLQGTTWNLSKTPLLKSLHALELMYTLSSYQLQCLAFWMAISVKQPEIRLKMLSGLVNVYAYLSV